MKEAIIYTLLFGILLTSCHRSAYVKTTYDEQQIFIDGHPSKFAKNGKCYQKSKSSSGELKWTAVICQGDLSKGMIQEIQNNLSLLGYNIDPFEIRKNRFGDTTKEAWIEFQKENGYNFGVIDYATIALLRNKSQ